MARQRVEFVMKRLKILRLATATAFGLLALSASGNADTYNITSDHSTDQGVTGGILPNNGLILTVTQGTDLLHVVATLAPGWGFIANGQDQASLMFALPNTLTASITNLTAGFAQVGPDGTVPGIEMNGNIFDGGINSLVGLGVIGGTPNAPAFALSFDISATGITLASLQEGGYQCSGGATCPNQSPISGVFFADIRNAQGLTGIVDLGLSQIPLPPAALLFGTALVGMGILGRRRRKGGLAQG